MTNRNVYGQYQVTLGDRGGVGNIGPIENHLPGQHYYLLLSLDLLICLKKVYNWDTSKFDLWGQVCSY